MVRKDGTPTTTHLAWNGLAMDIPSTWWPGVVNGRYLRLDSDEGPVLECKWAYGPGGSLDRRLARMSRKAGEPLEAASVPQEWKESLAGLARRGYRALPFAWGEEGGGCGVLLHHEAMRCTLVVNAFEVRGEVELEAVGHSLATLSLAEERGPLAWDVFGMAARTPAGFQLMEQRFHPGHFHLGFALPEDMAEKGGGAPEHLVLDRAGPAEVLLRGAGLADWAASFHKGLVLFRKASLLGASNERADWRLDGKSSWFRRRLVRNHRRHTACRTRVWRDGGSGFLATVHAAGTRPVKEEWFEGICAAVSFVPRKENG